jgi:hypothetical protein
MRSHCRGTGNGHYAPASAPVTTGSVGTSQNSIHNGQRGHARWAASARMTTTPPSPAGASRRSGLPTLEDLQDLVRELELDDAGPKHIPRLARSPLIRREMGRGRRGAGARRPLPGIPALLPRVTALASPAGPLPVDLLPRPAGLAAARTRRGGAGPIGEVANIPRIAPRDRRHDGRLLRAFEGDLVAPAALSPGVAGPASPDLLLPQPRPVRGATGRTRGGGRRAIGLGPCRIAGRVERRHAGIVRTRRRGLLILTLSRRWR